MIPEPIFVHSLFRSGSTYVFSAFRRSTAGYWCYQEPCHEYLRHVSFAPERLLDIHSRHGSMLRHPPLDKPYFWEFYQVRKAIAPLFTKHLSYDWFFIGDSNPSFKGLASYLQALIDNAQGRPLFQCCRTFGHVPALRNFFAGIHINLWRNPRDLWWSYKVGVSFDATVLLILNAMETPAILASVKALCEIPDIHDPDIEEEFAVAQSHCLTSADSYFALYALWVYAMLQVPRVADLSISIDSLSSSRSYRDKMLTELAGLGIQGLDFSDCAIVQAKFGRDDIAFFDQIETRVHDLYLQHGYAKEELAELVDLREQHRPRSRHSVLALAADAERVRKVAMQKSDNLAGTQRKLLQRNTELAHAQRVAHAQNTNLVAAASLAAALQKEAANTRATLAALQEELAGANARANALATELVNAKAEVAAMADDLVDARGRLESLDTALVSTRLRSALLQEELAAVGSRLEAAGRETNRWWTIADDTSRHLQAIYGSRSWRLTAPLREINAWRKRLSGSTGAGVAALGSMPRSVVRRLLLAAWAHARGRPERRARFVRLLAPFPRLYARLRSFAFAHATAPAATARAAASHDESPRQLEAGNDVRWDEYPASVQEIHSQLMRARAVVARATSQTQPNQARR